MKKICTLIYFLLFCGKVFSQVTITDSFMHGGLMRTYRLYVPAIYNGSNAVPVLLNLHGYTSNGQQQELYGDFRPIADTANFIIAHPDGTFDATGNRFWNVFGLSPVDDAGFLSALLDTMTAHYNINTNRVYSTGMSNGGYMSYQLACSMGNRITAIASVTGTMTVSMKDNCAPSHPVPVMQIHGTADAVVPYNGSGASLPLDTVVRYWVNANHCNTIPFYTAIPDIVPADGCTAAHYVYTGGDNGSVVELYKITGGGHTWPGAPVIIGVTNMDINASKEIWRFFSQYSLNNLVMGNNEFFHDDEADISIYPNPSSKNITIHFMNNDERELTLLNFSGQRIYHEYTGKSAMDITLSDTGIYFLQIRETEKITTHKIVILPQ